MPKLFKSSVLYGLLIAGTAIITAACADFVQPLNEPGYHRICPNVVAKFDNYTVRECGSDSSGFVYMFDDDESNQPKEVHQVARFHKDDTGITKVDVVKIHPYQLFNTVQKAGDYKEAVKQYIYGIYPNPDLETLVYKANRPESLSIEISHPSGIQDQLDIFSDGLWRASIFFDKSYTSGDIINLRWMPDPTSRYQSLTITPSGSKPDFRPDIQPYLSYLEDLSRSKAIKSIPDRLTAFESTVYQPIPWNDEAGNFIADEVLKALGK